MVVEDDVVEVGLVKAKVTVEDVSINTLIAKIICHHSCQLLPLWIPLFHVRYATEWDTLLVCVMSEGTLLIPPILFTILSTIDNHGALTLELHNI